MVVPTMSSDRATVDELIQSLGLLNPALPRADRKAGVLAIHEQTGAAVSTIYARLKRLAAGAADRKPRADRGASRSLPAEVQDAARALFTDRRWAKATTAELRDRLQKAFPAADLGYDALKRLRDHTEAELKRYGRAYIRVETALPNEQWAMDCSPSDVFTLLPGHDVPTRCQLTVVQDTCTRAVLYARYSATTGYDQIAPVFFQAIRRQSDQWPMCGLPDALVIDWGKNFVGRNFTLALDALGIKRVMSAPYHPQSKGKVERAIGVIHHKFEAQLPGYCGSDNTGEDCLTPGRDFKQLAPQVWLDRRYDDNAGDAARLRTLHELNLLLWDWIAGTYHHTVNSTMGMTPAQAWARHNITPRMFSQDYLEQTFLCRDTRKVSRGRISCNTMQYLHPRLCDYNGFALDVRYDPEDIREIYCYLDGRPLCTAVVDNPLFNDSPLHLKTLQETRRRNREVAARRRELLDQWQHEITAGDPLDGLAAAASAAPALPGHQPQLLPDPHLVARRQADELDDMFLGPLPGAAAGS